MSADKPTEVGTGVAKLPEWPNVASVDFQDTHESNWYYMEESAAALARMEALAAEVEQLRDEFLLGNPRYAEWLEIINALLAACERGDR